MQNNWKHQQHQQTNGVCSNRAWGMVFTYETSFPVCWSSLFSRRCVPDIEELVTHPHHREFNFFAVPPVHPRAQRDFMEVLPPRKGAYTRSDLCLPNSEWNARWDRIRSGCARCGHFFVCRVTGKVSPWLNFDSEHDWVRFNSEQVWHLFFPREKIADWMLKALRQELAWAAHLGLGAVVIDLPCNAGPNFARCINYALQTSYLQIWIKMRISSQEDEVTNHFLPSDFHSICRLILGATSALSALSVTTIAILEYVH